MCRAWLGVLVRGDDGGSARWIGGVEMLMVESGRGGGGGGYAEILTVESGRGHSRGGAEVLTTELG